MHILKTRNIGRQYPSSDTQRFNLSLQVFTLSLRDFRMGKFQFCKSLEAVAVLLSEVGIDG